MRRSALLLALLPLALASCDRDVTDSVTDRGDVEALLARAGLAPAGTELTLPALLRDVVRATQREQGTEAARLTLDRLQRLRATHTAAAGSADSLEAQVRLVLEVLGPAVLDRSLTGTAEQLLRLDTVVDSLPADAADVRELRRIATEQLAAARAASAAHDTTEALGLATAAAERTAQLRRAILDRDRVFGLPDLFDRARARIDSVAGPRASELLARHAQLTRAAQEAVAHAGRSDAHRALQAVRQEELRLTIGTLGPDVAEATVRSVRESLERLREPARQDVRLQRMHRAAHDLQVRAGQELAKGRPDAALDLASHAASLANALRLVTGLR